jgi:Fe-S cluster assembly protein SufD
MPKIIISTADHPHHIHLTEPGEYEVVITAAQAEVSIWGGWLVQGNDQLRICLTVIHQAPHTTSHTNLRAAVRDAGQAWLLGKIVVEEQAAGTDAFLSEKVLLLSEKATAQTVPDLEIKNNDVHCSHAATTSPIPPEQLFYLMSRGLDLAAAQNLIVEGFLAAPSTNHS